MYFYDLKVFFYFLQMIENIDCKIALLNLIASVREFLKICTNEL